jgi:tRNA 2-thiouridine synthesizing protein A
MKADPAAPGGARPRRTIDARGAYCPVPLMELIKAIRQQEVGDEIGVLSTDPNSDGDISNWAARQGHKMTAKIAHEGYAEYVVKKMK